MSPIRLATGSCAGRIPYSIAAYVRGGTNGRSLGGPENDAIISSSSFGSIAASCARPAKTIAKRIRTVYSSIAANEIPGVLRITVTRVLRMRGIGAQRTRASGRRSAFSDDGVGCLSTLHPIDDGAQHVEAVCRGGTAGTVAHSGNEKEATPILHILDPAILAAHVLVVTHGLERRKPRVAHAVVEDQFAAVPGERRQVGPGSIARSCCCIRSDIPGCFINVKAGSSRRWVHGTASAAQQDARNVRRIDDPGIKRKRWINLISALVFRHGERLLDS